MMKVQPVYPIILAAGASRRLGIPKPLARFGRRTALEIAVANCARALRPVVVLGWQAERVRLAVPGRALVVLNRRWRAGQLSSLLAGLRRLPRRAPFLLYPVDYPLLTRSIVHRLLRAFHARRAAQSIVMPVFRGRPGHPVIFAAEMRRELRQAGTAKEVIYRDRRRIMLVPVKTAAVRKDFHDPASYRAILREYRPRR